MFNERCIRPEYDGSRIIVISDIHGGIELLKSLLDKIDYCSDDYLIILGDFIQRGYKNKETLDWIIAISEAEKTYILSGNHEYYLCSILEPEYVERLDYHLKNIHYGCLIREWMTTDMHDLPLLELQDILKSNQEKYLNFLRNLPYALEMNNHLFVHGGIRKPYELSDRWDLLSMPEFYKKSHDYEGMVVVGHWPVQNYKPKSLSGEPILDHEKRMIAIDGGFGVKKSGQLNALVIEEDYSFFSIDTLREATLICDVHIENDSIVKLDYLDKSFEMIEKKESFSLVKKMSTGEEFLIKNELLDEDFSDYISYFVNGHRGDSLFIIEVYKDYLLVKKDHEIGWIKKEYVSDF